MRTRIVALLLSIPLGASSWCLHAAQLDEPFQNLQYFPEDTSRDELVQRMREFSFALGVRCQHCHAGGDGVSFEGVVFSSDEKTTKRKARAMLRMVDELNSRLLADLPERRATVRVDCVTCHRGLPVPRTLAMALRETIESDGADAAVERYRELRRETLPRGLYDFGEWSVNELARELREDGKLGDAIAMLEMNAELYPESRAIQVQLADLHLARGERDEAIARLRKAVEIAPQDEDLRERLEKLLTEP